MESYDEAWARCMAGQIVVFSFTTNAADESIMVGMAENLPPLHRMHYEAAPATARVRIAIRATIALRKRYGIAA